VSDYYNRAKAFLKEIRTGGINALGVIDKAEEMVDGMVKLADQQAGTINQLMTQNELDRKEQAIQLSRERINTLRAKNRAADAEFRAAVLEHKAVFGEDFSGY
jgi:hypothetical protein